MTPDLDDRTAKDRLVSEDEATSASATDDDESAGPLMVVSRARRPNAGNRMSNLLAQEETIDEQEKWGEDWEELPDEEEFVGEDAEDQGDFNLDSSSTEDEDEGDDDVGEKELKKAERLELREKKRKKAVNPFAARLAAARKRVKLDIPSSAPTETTPIPRPKKKSERTSWVPTPEEGPARQSSRRQTMMNKEETMERLKKKDKKRADTIAMMKAAEERKEKAKPKAMTQAERLAEAALVEKQNSKSLHRWEEAEEKRAAERQAKLDALKSRELEGPFIRYYSGPAIWVDNKLKFTGKDAPKIEELEDQPAEQPADPPKDRTSDDATATKDAATTNGVPPSTSQTAPAPTSESVPEPAPATAPEPATTPAEPEQLPPPPAYPNSIIFAPPQNPDSFLFGIEHWAAMPEPVAAPPSLPPTKPAVSPPATEPAPQPAPQPEPQPPQPIPRKIIERAVRNLIILTSFPSLPPPLKTRDKSALISLSQHLFSWPVSHATLAASAHPTSRTHKSVLPTPLRHTCAITGLPARYIDPRTGLAYRDKYAYKCIQRLVAGHCRWSKGLGCYVGPVYEREGVGGRPARGVPARFWGIREGDGAGKGGGSGEAKAEVK